MSPSNQPGEQVSVAAVLAPLVERWRALLLWLVGGWAVVAALVLIPARDYEARVQLAAISNQRSLPNLSSLGGAASLLGGALGGLQQSGLQVTPPLVKALMMSNSVLIAAGTAEPEPGKGRLVDRAYGGGSIPDEKVPRKMAKLLQTGVSTETGIISLKVALEDSALARVIVDRILDETRKAYVVIARSQASQQRQGQQARVDSASSQLARAEQALSTFETTNRSLTTYSSKVVERQALERRVQITQQVYLQAVTEREAAIARELEATPVLAIVDPMPAVLPHEQRYLVVKLLLASVAITLMWGLVLLVQEGYRRQDTSDPDILRLRRAVTGLPLIGSRGHLKPPA